VRVIGDRALLFTDIEGSTALLQRLGPVYADVLDQHHRIMRNAIERAAGVEVQNEGDAFAVLFPTAVAAVSAAVDAQCRLREGPWPKGTVVTVRMGINWGEIGRSESGYVGMPLHETARVASAAHGGQILISESARERLTAESPGRLPVELRMLGRFSLKDIGDDVPLIQVIHPDLPHAFPPPRTGGGRLNNLPAQLTSLVGRETEAIEVGEFVRRHRLVTLSGAGGIGKTRLALSVAADAASGFTDGVWLVELASVRTGADLVDAVRLSAALAEEPLTEAELVATLAAKNLLLVLDNCEHLLDDVAAMVDRITKACPRVHVLATSREPFGTVGEMTWRVPSLATNDAVSLFVARAELAAPGIELGPPELDAIDRVCRRLDGIPLAIELAAARAGTIPLAQIEERLLDGFRLLNASSRGGVARHQTLRATLEWSYDLLNSEEQRVFRRLSILRNPELDSVEIVCGDDQMVDVLEVVHGLQTKSLIAIDASRMPSRVRVSEIVRQFAAELLEASDERPALAERHARYFLAASHRARRGCLGPNRLDWLRRFADDEADYAVAFDWWSEHGPSDAAVLVGNAKEWLVACDNRPWLHRLQVITERPDLDPASVGIVCSLRAILAGLYGRESAEVAARSAARALEHLDAVVDSRDRLRALTNMALGFREADPSLAAELAARAMDEADALGDDVETAWSLLDLILVRHEHDPETLRLRAQLLERIDRIGAQWTNVGPLVDQALGTYQVGEYDEALARLDAAEQMLARLPQRHEVVSEDAHALDVWEILIRAELGDTAVAILIAEDRLARLADRRSHQAKELAGPYGQALMLAGQPDAARAAFELATDRADGWRYLVFAISMIGRATLAIAEGRPEEAVALAEGIAEENRRMWVRARARDVLAEAALAVEDLSAARTHAQIADRIRQDGGFVVPPALRPRVIAVRRALAVVDA
jgi:predicted ATPase/class 3 adenylate cyclase/tetratricopeptide (TPR) repeat protein